MPVINLKKDEINSISDLQRKCNTLEKQVFKKLTKLEAVFDVADVKVTEATFEGGKKSELGKVKITQGGNHSTWLKDSNDTVPVSISRP